MTDEQLQHVLETVAKNVAECRRAEDALRRFAAGVREAVLRLDEPAPTPVPASWLVRAGRMAGRALAAVFGVAMNNWAVIVLAAAIAVAQQQGCLSPAPGPAPPDPVVPIPKDGLRVLIVYQDAKVGGYTPEQREIIFGAEVRDWLDANCVKEGGTTEYRIWDVEQLGDLSNVARHWQEAAKRPRSSLPWLVASNGSKGWEGPLPTRVEDFKAIVSKVK